VEFDKKVSAYSNPSLIRMVKGEGFDGIAGKPFLDKFHWENGTGGELCLESWSQFNKTEL